MSLLSLMWACFSYTNHHPSRLPTLLACVQSTMVLDEEEYFGFDLPGELLVKPAAVSKSIISRVKNLLRVEDIKLWLLPYR